MRYDLAGSFRSVDFRYDPRDWTRWRFALEKVAPFVLGPDVAQAAHVQRVEASESLRCAIGEGRIRAIAQEPISGRRFDLCEPARSSWLQITQDGDVGFAQGKIVPGAFADAEGTIVMLRREDVEAHVLTVQGEQ